MPGNGGKLGGRPPAPAAPGGGKGRPPGGGKGRPPGGGMGAQLAPGGGKGRGGMPRPGGPGAGWDWVRLGLGKRRTVRCDLRGIMPCGKGGAPGKPGGGMPVSVGVSWVLLLSGAWGGEETGDRFTNLLGRGRAAGGSPGLAGSAAAWGWRGLGLRQRRRR